MKLSQKYNNKGNTLDDTKTMVEEAAKNAEPIDVEKLVDAAGRVEKFKAKYNMAK